MFYFRNIEVAAETVVFRILTRLLKDFCSGVKMLPNFGYHGNFGVSFEKPLVLD